MGVNFVIGVAAPDAEWRVEVADFVNAIGEGIAAAGDQVASDDGEIGALLVGEIDGAANVFTAHVAAEVNVADLRDGHAVEGGRQVADRDFDAANLVVHALGGEAVNGSQERSCTGHGG